MASVTTSRLWVMYSTISLSPARFTSLNLRSLSGSDTKSKRTQHWRSFWIKSSSRSWVGESGVARQQSYSPPRPFAARRHLPYRPFPYPDLLPACSPGSPSPGGTPSHTFCRTSIPPKYPKPPFGQCPVTPRPGAPAPLTFSKYLSGQEASATPDSC